MESPKSPTDSITRTLVRSGPRRILRGVAIAAGVFIAFVLCTLWYVGVFGGNVRIVRPHQLYRSAQLTGATLRHALKANKIGTVVNLRGAETWDGGLEGDGGAGHVAAI